MSDGNACDIKEQESICEWQYIANGSLLSTMVISDLRNGRMEGNDCGLISLCDCWARGDGAIKWPGLIKDFINYFIFLRILFYFIFLVVW